jgi:hypothetical protein
MIKILSSEKHKGAEPFFASGEEEYHPGVSVFKGKRMQVWALTLSLWLI